MKPRFHVNQRGQLGGVEWRIVQGVKAPDDLRLDIRTRGWTPPTMGLGFLFADFYSQNEQTLYPARGDQAGARYLNFVGGSVWMGWEAANEQLLDERQAARPRLFMTNERKTA